MAVALPEMERIERLAHLSQANLVRVRRAELKRQLRKDSREQAARYAEQIIEEPIEWLRSMKAIDLLRALPRVGERKAERMLFHAQVSHRARLGGLTNRQRAALAELVARYGAGIQEGTIQ